MRSTETMSAADREAGAFGDADDENVPGGDGSTGRNRCQYARKLPPTRWWPASWEPVRTSTAAACADKGHEPGAGAVDLRSTEVDSRAGGAEVTGDAVIRNGHELLTSLLEQRCAVSPFRWPARVIGSGDPEIAVGVAWSANSTWKVKCRAERRAGDGSSRGQRFEVARGLVIAPV